MFNGGLGAPSGLSPGLGSCNVPPLDGEGRRKTNLLAMAGDSAPDLLLDVVGGQQAPPLDGSDDWGGKRGGSSNGSISGFLGALQPGWHS